MKLSAATPVLNWQGANAPMNPKSKADARGRLI
jgi:hypothetical protein